MFQLNGNTPLWNSFVQAHINSSIVNLCIARTGTHGPASNDYQDGQQCSISRYNQRILNYTSRDHINIADQSPQSVATRVSQPAAWDTMLLKSRHNQSHPHWAWRSWKQSSDTKSDIHTGLSPTTLNFQSVLFEENCLEIATILDESCIRVSEDWDRKSVV